MILRLPSLLVVLCLILQSRAVTVGETPGKPVLRVVYFTPNDGEPIPGHVERLDKVLEHIRAASCL